MGEQRYVATVGTIMHCIVRERVNPLMVDFLLKALELVGHTRREKGGGIHG
jgi:hypothetical protein